MTTTEGPKVTAWPGRDGGRGCGVSAPAHKIAAILAAAIASAADSRPDGEVDESDVIDVALDCAHGELTEAFGTETADRICADERAYVLCEALLRFHWSTGGAL